jgi:hypothetical protein
MRLLRRIRSHVLACVAAGVVSSTAASAQPAPAPAAAPYQVVTGTICRVDARAGTYDLVTGVGHALRIHRFRLAAGVAVSGRGAQGGVAALIPGAICRLECRTEPVVTVASKVEVLEPAPGQRP